MSNISGFSDLNKRNDEKNEGNEFYTGGNDSRGGGSSSYPHLLNSYSLHFVYFFPYLRGIGSGLNVLDPVDRYWVSFPIKYMH